MLKEREGIMHRVRCPRRRGIKDGQEHWPEVGGRVLSLMCQEREQMWEKSVTSYASQEAVVEMDSA